MMPVSWIRLYENESYHKTEVEWDVGIWPVGSEQQTEIFSHSAISIYPNPADDNLNVKILGEQNGEALIELYDSQGRQMQSCIMRYPGNHSLGMSSLEAGIYMIRICLDGKYFTSRRIIKH